MRPALAAAMKPTVAWATLLLLSMTQAALLVDAARGTHGYCVEHEGAVHHLSASSANTRAGEKETLALVAPGSKKTQGDAAHDHCGALGTGLRPAIAPGKACTPRFEKQPVQKPRELEAKPVVTEPIYARAPKTSPPSNV
jgi:hypothetical protein